METYGLVKQITDHYAVVKVVRESACSGNCAACNACENKEIEMRVENSVGAQKGDIVRITSSSRQVLRSVFILYLLPVLLVLAVWITTAQFLQTLPVVLITLGVVIIFYILIKKMEHKLVVSSEITDIIRK